MNRVKTNGIPVVLCASLSLHGYICEGIDDRNCTSEEHKAFELLASFLVSGLQGLERPLKSQISSSSRVSTPSPIDGGINQILLDVRESECNRRCSMDNVVKAAFLGFSGQSVFKSAWCSNVGNEGKSYFAFPLRVYF